MSVRMGGLQVAVSAIIPAAGFGRRMGGGTAKQFLPLCGEPVLLHTVRRFVESPLVDEILIAASDLESTREIVGHMPKVTEILLGGRERQDSVYAALKRVHSRPRVICVHDAVRPLLSDSVLSAVLLSAAEYPAQVVAVPVQETVKVVGADGLVRATPDRSSLYLVQTPQVFWAEPMLEAFSRAEADGFIGTDCASVLERMGVPVRICLGSPTNIKLTTQSDFLLAEAILAQRIS